MKTVKFQGPSLRALTLGISACVAAATCQAAIAQEDQDATTTTTARTTMPITTTSTQPVSAGSTVRTFNAPGARSTGSAKDYHQHAGAKIINDADDADQTATTPTPSKAGEVPIVDYKESAAVQSLCDQAVRYNGEKHYLEAASILKTAITRDPRTVLARRLYAMTSVLNQQPREAVTTLETLGKYTRATTYDKCLLASAYWALGDPSAAADSFREACALSPTNFYAEEGYLKSMVLARNFDVAMTECASALRRFTTPGAQATLKKLYAEILSGRAVAKETAPPAGDSRLSPPIPLPELTPYMIRNSYGG